MIIMILTSISLSYEVPPIISMFHLPRGTDRWFDFNFQVFVSKPYIHKHKLSTWIKLTEICIFINLESIRAFFQKNESVRL